MNQKRRLALSGFAVRVEQRALFNPQNAQARREQTSGQLRPVLVDSIDADRDEANRAPFPDSFSP